MAQDLSHWFQSLTFWNILDEITFGASIILILLIGFQSYFILRELQRQSFRRSQSLKNRFSKIFNHHFRLKKSKRPSTHQWLQKPLDQLAEFIYKFISPLFTLRFWRSLQQKGKSFSQKPRIFPEFPSRPDGYLHQRARSNLTTAVQLVRGELDPQATQKSSKLPSMFTAPAPQVHSSQFWQTLAEDSKSEALSNYQPRFRFVLKPSPKESLSDFHDLDHLSMGLAKDERIVVLTQLNGHSTHSSRLQKWLNGQIPREHVVCEKVYPNIDIVVDSLGFFQSNRPGRAQELTRLLDLYDQVVLFFPLENQPHVQRCFQSKELPEQPHL